MTPLVILAAIAVVAVAWSVVVQWASGKSALSNIGLAVALVVLLAVGAIVAIRLVIAHVLP